MEDYQKRVIVERDDLNEKIVKLRAFAGSESFHSLHPMQRDLLSAQLSAMEAYRTILTIRINSFA